LADVGDEVRTTASTRKRALPFHGGWGDYVSWVRDTSPPPAYNESRARNEWRPSNLQGTEVTSSESHPSWRRRLGTGQDVGGNFSSVKQYVATQNVPMYRLSGSKDLNSFVTIGYDYRGPIVADSLVAASFPPHAASTDSVLNAVGAGAVATVKPTNNIADVSTALLELYREGLPRIMGSSFWRSSTESALKRGAGEYLNAEFGWAPLVSDVRAFAFGISHASKLLTQFNRDSGKVVRRRMSFPPIMSEATTVYKSGVAGPYLTSSTLDMFDTSGRTGQVLRHRKTTVRRWFSGAFTYHSNVAADPASLNRLDGMSQDADHLLGVDITPETLWNLAPWSWAADWVSSMGDVISNLQDHIQYGLVMPYGYLMEHSIVRDTYFWDGPTTLKADRIVPSPITLVSETKLRRKANPYGFGLTWDELSSRQQSILAALGITRRGH
jgi:hypothetical protein